MVSEIETSISKKRCIKTLNSKLLKKIYSKFDTEVTLKTVAPYNVIYREIIYKTIDLMRDELNLEDPMDISLVYRYMALNGYFSKNKKFEITEKDRVCELSNYGLDIIRGKGVCLNLSTMLNDILNFYGIESHVVGCEISNPYERFSYKRLKKYYYSLLPKIYDSVIGKTFVVGNHATVLTKYNDNVFIIDPTYGTFYHFIAFLVAMDAETSFVCDLKPFSCGAFFGVNPETILEVLLETEKQNYIENIQSTKILKEKREYFKNICEKNKPLFEDFHNDISKDINTVCKILKK